MPEEVSERYICTQVAWFGAFSAEVVYTYGMVVTQGAPCRLDLLRGVGANYIFFAFNWI